MKTNWYLKVGLHLRRTKYASSSLFGGRVGKVSHLGIRTFKVTYPADNGLTYPETIEYPISCLYQFFIPVRSFKQWDFEI